MDDNPEETAKAKVADLERENFVLKEQLHECKVHAERVTKENESLRTVNQSLEKSALEKSSNYLHIDRERETLLIDKARYQSENTQLKHQKELLEAQTSRLLTEKRSFSEDIQTLKAENQKAFQRIAKLQTDIDEFQSEKSILAHDKERWAQEKELYGKNREWYMSELADREKAISSLRLQIVQFDRELMIKNAELGNSVDDFTLRNETLATKLEEQEEECRVLREKNAELSNENRAVVESITAELQVKDNLIRTYKDEIASCKLELENYKNDDTELREALTEKDFALNAVSEENQRIIDEARDQVADRELRIIQLQDELDKANDLLKFGTSALPGGDVSNFSASAAELLSSGTSLTSIYAQHCKVLAELTEEKQKQKQLEEYVRSLLEDLRKNAPNVLSIRKENDTLHIERDELRRQLKKAFNDRDALQSDSDNAARELKFTRTELVSTQHENATLKKQVQKLLYVAEEGSGHFDPNVSVDDVATFSNIRDLHERNIELIHQVEELRRSNDESVRQARQEEIENLQVKLSEYDHEVKMLRDSQEKTTFIMAQLEKQRDGYKEELEHRQRSPMKSLNNSRSFIESDSGSEWKAKCEKLEEKLLYVIDDKHKTEAALNERVSSQMDHISQLRMTNGRIESDLEYQKKNQETAFKKVNELEKEILKKNEQVAKLKAQFDSEEQKTSRLTNELNLKLDEFTKLNFNYQNLSNKYDVARNNAVSYEAELKVIRQSRYSSERMNLTLEGLENLLKVNEKEKMEQIKSQLDVLAVERDNYRNAVEDIRSNAERRNMEFQATLGEAIAAKDKLQVELKYQREQYANMEQLLEATKVENAELLKKFEDIKSADFSVDGLNKEVQQLRNKNLYHEKQLADQRLQLDQLKARLEAKDKELQELQRLTGGFENTMKTQDELQQEQQTRLQEQVDELTIEIDNARNLIEELNQKVFEAEARENDHTRILDTERRDYQVQIAELQKTLTSSQSSLEGKNKEIADLLLSLQQAQSDRDSVDARVKLLDDQLVSSENQISELKIELQNTRDRFETASNEHDAMISRLRNSVMLLEKEKARLTQELKELQDRDHEQKLNMDSLYDKIQSLTQDSLLGSQLDTSSSALNTSQSSDNSLTTVVDILRKIKDKEMELRMAAEIELSRIKAQAHIDEQKIQDLSNQIEELNMQVQINAQLMNEKNDLINRLGSLQSVQRRNEALQQEVNSMRVKITAMGQEVNRLNSELDKVSKAKESSVMQYNTVLQERDIAVKDLEEIRKRCTEAENRIAHNPAAEKEKADLLEKLNKSMSDANTIRKLARKYRDEHSACPATISKLQADVAKLEAEKKQMQEEAIPAGPQLGVKRMLVEKNKEILALKNEITNLNEKIETSTKANDELKQQLEESKSKVNDNSEINMRLSSLTTHLTSMKAKAERQDVELKQLTAERDKLIAEVESLKAEVASQTAAASQSAPNLFGESSTQETSSRKRTLQEVNEPGFEMLANAKKARSESHESQNAEVVDEIGDMSQSNDAPECVPSVEQPIEEQMDEDIVPEDDGNLDFGDADGDQDYFNETQDAEPFLEPPNLAHDEENNDDEQYEDYENSGLPSYPQEDDQEGDEAMENYEDYDEAEDDDDDADIHSEQPDEGEEFDERNDDESGSDDDIVVLD